MSLYVFPTSPEVPLAFLDLGNVTGAVVLDGAIASAWRMRLIGNVIVTPANLTPGRSYSVEVVQDGTGGRTFSAPAVDFSTAADSIVSAAPNANTFCELTARSAVAAFGALAGDTLGGWRFRDLGFGFPNEAKLNRVSGSIQRDDGAGTGIEVVGWSGFGTGLTSTQQINLVSGAASTVRALVGATPRILADANGVDVFGARVVFVAVVATPVVATIDTYIRAGVGASVVNLPAMLAGMNGQSITVKNRSGVAVTVNANAGNTIDGVASQVIANKQIATFTAYFPGLEWLAAPG